MPISARTERTKRIGETSDIYRVVRETDRARKIATERGREREGVCGQSWQTKQRQTLRGGRVEQKKML